MIIVNLSSDILYDCIFVYIQNQSNIGFINKRTYLTYKTLRSNAMNVIGKFLISKQLPMEYFLNVPITYTYRNRKLLIRLYLATYPKEHLDNLIDLFSPKLLRPELSMLHVPRPRTRRDLKYLLSRCSATEIMYVGW